MTITPTAGYGSGLYGDTTYDAGTPPTEGDFLLNEDLALKNLLLGLTVTDGNNANRPVGVRFGEPDPEIAEQKYPYIIIDLIDVRENTPQVMSDYGPPENFDYLALPTGDDYYGVTGFIVSPMLLTYQVSSWSRQPRHDRQILSALNHGPLHPRAWQGLPVSDGTLRRLIVTGFVKRDTTTAGRRLFRNIWTVQIPSEIVYSPLDLTRRVEQVTINTEQTNINLLA